MLKLLLPMIMLLPTSWLCKKNHLSYTTLLFSFTIALLSLQWLKPPFELTTTFSNTYMGVDPISTPLLILTSWMTPLMILVSKNHLIQEPLSRKRTFTTTIISLQISLTLAFSALEMMLFFTMFEATLIPTLIIITRWGNQMERLSAGTYFLFYTLIGSLPLLIALTSLHTNYNTLSLFILQLNPPNLTNSWAHTMWWFALLMAFMIKMPLYGLHLWLPKAHVEAPIAGSMILAGVLLKLGGYGIIRVTLMLNPLTKSLSYPFMTLSLWGIIMTGLICLRQTDLKSLIAYSSVGLMGLVISAALLQTPLSITGAIILMIAHGLSSSMLFCLANTNYERTHNRTLLLTHSMQTLLPLMTIWWLLASLMNMALPPTINLMGELTIIASLFSWANITIILTGLGTLISALYSLHMFSTTQWGGTPPHHMHTITPSHTREHLIMMLHMVPLILLMMKPQLMTTF
uniref:NADH-ubiquinone oxidoreductase chain 4 n=1 Tax=Pelomedusa subrufa TaxID=44522 RepID=NU4M_PELSU|nr:NADH dehydrogenase subunit 4 [Pelomedusa subrufa]O79677.1 RecName: Full=NADH-ubiquinone oxidoreductase chain 4; AltName: Full=NADH dehydrogenase subunit 4 [Pelomedusa subrufa]AAD05057.1 NADH dehydrogenase subunit 4 [Pelomedusa subrufa]